MRPILIAIALAVGALAACHSVPAPHKGYDVIVIDGCQYIRWNGAPSATHKGDCTNSIHVYWAQLGPLGVTPNPPPATNALGMPIVAHFTPAAWDSTRSSREESKRHQ